MACWSCGGAGNNAAYVNTPARASTVTNQRTEAASTPGLKCVPGNTPVVVKYGWGAYRPGDNICLPAGQVEGHRAAQLIQ